MQMVTDNEIHERLPDVVMPACPVHKIPQGQKALVTGGDSGIGRGIATALYPGFEAGG